MKYFKFGFGIIVTAIIFAGCYTQLLTPQQYVKYRTQSKSESHPQSGDAGTSLNYSRDCLSCHSKYELEDRYQELSASGLITVHGYTLERSLWDSPYAIEYYTPDPYGWRRPVFSEPWWIPPAAAIGASSSSQASKDRTRTGGNTRDENSRENRSEPLPAYVPSAAPAGGSTSAPSNPTPAASAVSSAPASPPPPASSETRTRSSSSDDSSPRTTGSSRDRR